MLLSLFQLLSHYYVLNDRKFRMKHLLFIIMSTSFNAYARQLHPIAVGNRLLTEYKNTAHRRAKDIIQDAQNIQSDLEEAHEYHASYHAVTKAYRAFIHSLNSSLVEEHLILEHEAVKTLSTFKQRLSQFRLTRQQQVTLTQEFTQKLSQSHTSLNARLLKISNNYNKN